MTEGCDHADVLLPRLGHLIMTLTEFVHAPNASALARLIRETVGFRQQAENLALNEFLGGCLSCGAMLRGLLGGGGSEAAPAPKAVGNPLEGGTYVLLGPEELERIGRTPSAEKAEGAG